MNLSSLLLIGTSTLALVACSSQAPYQLDQQQTGVVEFAPSVISTSEHFEINTVFNKTGDNVIFARCNDAFSHCTLMESQHEGGQWQAPKALPFSGDFLDADPYYSPDFQTLYFVSKRPIDGGIEASKSINLWRVSRQGESWGSPEYLKNLSSEEHDLYPSITSNGDLYFPSFRNNQRKMYVAKKTATGFDKPIALPTYMFGEGAAIGDSVVLPDGNSIIFSMRRGDSVGNGDLYISHKHNGKWSVAKTLGEKVNTVDHEFTPIVSPDGNYLFFTRIESGKGNLYQVSLPELLE